MAFPVPQIVYDQQSERTHDLVIANRNIDRIVGVARHTFEDAISLGWKEHFPII